MKRWAISCVADSDGQCLCMSGHDGKANETVLGGCHKLFIAGLCCLCRLSSKREIFSSLAILNPVSLPGILPSGFVQFSSEDSDSYFVR